MPRWMHVVQNNLKLAAVGTVAVLVAGSGAATTVTLSGSESDLPDTVVATASSALPTSLGSVSDTPTVGIDLDDADDAEASPSATPTAGIRPTDTHGYCVSTAVHAATAAPGGNLGAAKSAAAHSCPKANQKPKPAKPAKPAKAHPAKPAKVAPSKGHGKPAAGSAGGKARGTSGKH